jgi:hypothetical protein
MAGNTAFPLVGLEAQKYDKLLNGPLTYNVVFQKAHLCPCRDPRGSGADSNCQICHGFSYYWEAIPVNTTPYTDQFYWGSQSICHAGKLSRTAVSISSITDEYGTVYTGFVNDLGMLEITAPHQPPDGAQVTIQYTAPEQWRIHAEGLRTTREWLDRGEVQVGDIECTIPVHGPNGERNPAWYAAEHDLFWFPDARKLYRNRLTRGKKDQLTYPHVHSVVLCAARVNQLLVQYVLGTDFTVQNGLVTWLAGRGPDVGTPYVLEVIVSPSFFVCQEIPQMRHANGEAFPRRLHMRLFETHPARKP